MKTYSFSRRILLLTVAFILCAFGSLGVLQYSTAGKLTQAETQLLEAKDSIAMLSQTVHRQEQLLAEKESELTMLRADTLRMGQEILRLNTDLTSSRAWKAAADAKIKNLLAEQGRLFDAQNVSKTQADALGTQLKITTTEKDSLLRVIGEFKKIIADKDADRETIIAAAQVAALRARKATETAAIVKNARIDLQGVVLEDDEERPIRKVNKSWEYTGITFRLDYPQDPGFLIGRTFLLQLCDVGTGEPVAELENNPLFPNSDKGAQFTVERTGQEFYFRLHNYQEKIGKHYSLRIWYLPDPEASPDERHPLATQRYAILNRLPNEKKS